ncbi:hypothetical protein, partial [Ferrovibrio sp.]|uniref:hypothetical protein n=1 Tax=Ferrovibrio sp. TaxID=1917215 RepID=UPI0035B44B9D
HREGLLDADKTDGPTGFLGIYDHEAIEKFQKENGLKQDGWMGPGGETIKAFETLYAPVKNQPQQPQPQLPWKDYRPNLFDPKTWAIWDRMDARERNFQAQQSQQQGQEIQQTETLSGGNAEDDAAPVQLAQQEDGLPQPQDRGAQAPEPDNLEPEKATPEKAQESAGDIADALGLDTKKIDLTNPDIQAALIGTRFYNYFDPQTQQKTLSQVEKIKSIDPKLHGKLRSAVADSRASPIWQPTLLTDEQLEKHIKETEAAHGWLKKFGDASDTGKAIGRIPTLNIPQPVRKGNTWLSLTLKAANKSFERGLERLYEERDRRQKLND